MRLKNLRAEFDKQNIDAVLIIKDVNVRYFSGFTGDSTALIVSRRDNILITDGRYDDQARLECPQFEIVKHETGLMKMIAERLKELNLRNVGFEGDCLTFNQYAKLQSELPDWHFNSVKLDPLRQIKDADEINLIKTACDIADRAFDEILNYIKAGVREIDIAAALEHFMRLNGSERPAFDTIIASGVRGSYPHGRASEKIIADGEFVTMDFGAVFKGYHSDITRTVAVGRVNDDQRRLYKILLDAQQHGLENIRPGVSGVDVDKKVRDFLAKHGLEKYFTHGLGHGVGLEIHEEPRLSKLSDCKSLQLNMIVTDEPGIYIPNVGGLRIEDTVLITADGAQPLTHSPKHLIELNN